VENPRATTRRKIVAAVEVAGIEINNLDARRRMLAETGRTVGSLNARGVLRVIEEARWRWPERWDRDQRRKKETCLRVRRGRHEYILRRRQVRPGDEILPWPDDAERWT
jgi:zona occludens toxin (predicted ATPase)